jgi:hypothetical protein
MLLPTTHYGDVLGRWGRAPHVLNFGVIDGGEWLVSFPILFTFWWPLHRSKSLSKRKISCFCQQSNPNSLAKRPFLYTLSNLAIGSSLSNAKKIILKNQMLGLQCYKATCVLLSESESVTEGTVPWVDGICMKYSILLLILQSCDWLAAFHLELLQEILFIAV